MVALLSASSSTTKIVFVILCSELKTHHTKQMQSQLVWNFGLLDIVWLS